jgi:hypothetical protein
MYFVLNTKVWEGSQNFSYDLLSKFLYQNVALSVDDKNNKKKCCYFLEL